MAFALSKQCLSELGPHGQKGGESLEAFVWTHRECAHGPVAEFWEDARDHCVSCGVSLPALAENGVRGMLTLARGSDHASEMELAAKWP